MNGQSNVDMAKVIEILERRIEAHRLAREIVEHYVDVPFELLRDALEVAHLYAVKEAKNRE